MGKCMLLLQDGNLTKIVSDWVYDFPPAVYYHYESLSCEIYKFVSKKDNYFVYVRVQ